MEGSEKPPIAATADEFRRWATEWLGPVATPSEIVGDPQLVGGDHDLNPDFASAAHELARPAAVLVPIVPRDDGLTVLFTKRAEHLSSHAGQVSFPGGKIEAGDRGPVEAALRESEEEIGLAPSFVEVLGALNDYRTGTGYMITPVVALLLPGFRVVADRSEVADVFEVPLGFLMDGANHHLHSREWRGALRSYYAIPYGDHTIWGATAGILHNLYERLIERCCGSS